MGWYLDVLPLALHLRLLFIGLQLPEFLLLIVELEVVNQPGCRDVVGKHDQHLLASLRVILCAVSSLTSWLVLIQRVFDVDELVVGNVFNMQPLNLDLAWPLAALLPEIVAFLSVLDVTLHLADSTEVLGLIDRKEKVNVSTHIRVFLSHLLDVLVGLFKHFVSFLS